MSATIQSADDRHAAAIYELMALRLRYMTETIAAFIDHSGGQTTWQRPNHTMLRERYEGIASEWLVESLGATAAPVAALAKFAALVNIDRGLVDLITDNETIAGDELDHYHVGLALRAVIQWCVQRDDEEAKQKAFAAGGAA